MYNITKTEKGILIHDRFFLDDWDGFMNCFAKNEIGASTNLGKLEFETIEISKVQIEEDPDPSDLFFIIENVIFSLDIDFYYYRDWTDINKIYYNDMIKLGYKMPPLPNIKKGGFIEGTDDFELLLCQPNWDLPSFKDL